MATIIALVTARVTALALAIARVTALALVIALALTACRCLSASDNAREALKYSRNVGHRAEGREGRALRGWQLKRGGN